MDEARAEGRGGKAVIHLAAGDGGAVPPQDGVVQHRGAGAVLAIVVDRPAGNESHIAGEGDVGQAGTAAAADVAIVDHRPAKSGGHVAGEGDIGQAGAAVAAISAIIDHRPAGGGSRIAKESDVGQAGTAVAAILAIIDHRPASGSCIAGEGEVAQAGAAHVAAAVPVAVEAAAAVVGGTAAIGLPAGNREAVEHRRPGDGCTRAVGHDHMIGIGAHDMGGGHDHAVGIRAVIAADVAAENSQVGQPIALGAQSLGSGKAAIDAHARRQREGGAEVTPGV